MSVDVFGRTLKRKADNGIRGPPGLGYKLDADGNFDIEKKKLRNLSDPVASGDAVTLEFLDKKLEHIPEDVVNFNILKSFHEPLKADILNLRKQISEKRKATETQGPPGIGYKLDKDGNFNIENKKLRNISDPTAGGDAVTLDFLKKKWRGSQGPAGIGYKLDKDGNFNIVNKKLRNLSEPIASNDAVTLDFLEKKLQEVKGIPGIGYKLDKDGHFDIENKKLRNIGDPIENGDALNYRSQRELHRLLESRILLVKDNHQSDFSKLEARIDQLKKNIEGYCSR